MRAYDNGIYRDMTEAEIAEMEAMQAALPEAEPTPEESIAQLEEALEMILSGVTE